MAVNLSNHRDLRLEDVGCCLKVTINTKCLYILIEGLLSKAIRQHFVLLQRNDVV